MPNNLRQQKLLCGTLSSCAKVLHRHWAPFMSGTWSAGIAVHDQSWSHCDQAACSLLAFDGCADKQGGDRTDRKRHWDTCLSLCEDQSNSVRAMMLDGLQNMAISAEAVLMTGSIRPQIVRMWADRAPVVRAAAFQALYTGLLKPCISLLSIPFVLDWPVSLRLVRTVIPGTPSQGAVNFNSAS